MGRVSSPNNLRLSDAERAEAMSALGEAFGQGRLSLDEYDSRCKAAAAANFRSDLAPLFQDIPQRPQLEPLVLGGSTVVPRQAEGEMQVYTAQEIMQARRSGQRMRAGAFWLGTIGSIVGGAAIGVMGLEILGGLTIMLGMPALFILLYVMKVGPDSWYQPSLRELERNRRQAVVAKQLELEAAQAYEQAQRKLERKAQIDRLTGDALDVAQQTVNRFRPKGD